MSVTTTENEKYLFVTLSLNEPQWENYVFNFSVRKDSLKEYLTNKAEYPLYDELQITYNKNNAIHTKENCVIKATQAIKDYIDEMFNKEI